MNEHGDREMIWKTSPQILLPLNFDCGVSPHKALAHEVLIYSSAISVQTVQFCYEIQRNQTTRQHGVSDADVAKKNARGRSG